MTRDNATEPTPVAHRRRKALAELVLGVATSFAVTEPGNEEDLRIRYGLTQQDMDKLKETIGARLEAWASRLGIEDVLNADPDGQLTRVESRREAR